MANGRSEKWLEGAKRAGRPVSERSWSRLGSLCVRLLASKLNQALVTLAPIVPLFATEQRRLLSSLMNDDKGAAKTKSISLRLSRHL